MGNYNQCYDTNVHRYTCECGYLKETTVGKKAHVYTRKNNINSYEYIDVCLNCNWSSGNLIHRCINRNNGKEISCVNLGVCSLCNYNYTNAIHIGEGKVDRDKEIKCRICNIYMGEINNYYITNSKDGQFEYYVKMTIAPNIIYKNVRNYSPDSNIKLTNSPKIQGNVLENTQIGNYIAYSEMSTTTRMDYDFTINGITSHILLSADVKSDRVPPIISNINIENELTEWKKIKPITISGIENYCTTVKVKIIDDEENIIYEGTTSVNDNKYEITCTPEFEANAEGRPFKAIVTDNLENSTEQEFTIEKVDSTAPEPISENKIGGEWAKTKNFTFKATDEGIGNVQIAFNDISDLQIATLNESGEYEREYEFTGDVYSSKELSVLYKDELGNTTIQKITIDKLDNTAPSITNASIHNNKLTIDANDIKEGMGEGSGVEKYRYITSAEKIENPKVPDTATAVNVGEDFIIPNIDKAKYIYIVAEDLVGNVSNIYEYEVPQLILTSKVNLNVANGKCGIELDWSSYDLEDKYFVIYRKQENETEWKTIVSLDQKLTRGKYTDTLGNDKTKPSAPSISIDGKTESNNIQIIRRIKRYRHKISILY